MKENIKIKTFSQVDQISEFFAEKLVKEVGETPDGSHYTIAFSGGSTPEAIYKYLAVHYKDKIDWNKVLVFWGDERCVAPDHDDSNFKMASESLLNEISIPQENIFRIRGEGDPSDEARRYGEVIREQVALDNDIPRFDMVMLGLGTDGHTASIFSDSMHLFQHDQVCDAVAHPVSKQIRVTITGPVINHAKTVAFLVTGESKAKMVNILLEQKEGWNTLPASQIVPTNGELMWLLDEAAASNLKIEL